MGIREMLGITERAVDTIPTISFYEMDTKINAVLGQSPAELYKSQPNLRIVVDTLARNVAQLGLHTFELVNDNDRQRNRTSEVAKMFKRPNEDTTTYELVYELVADLALHDIAYWLIYPSTLPGQEWMVRGLRAESIVGTRGGTIFAPEEYIFVTEKGQRVYLPASSMVVFKGWNPSSYKRGTSKVEALKLILEEQMHAYAARVQVWRKAGRVGTVISRPAGAPPMDQTQERKWLRAFERQTTGGSSGGNVMLQDGTKLEKLRFSAHEEDFVDAGKLSLSTTASVYNLNPVMVGVNDAANYSNVKEFNKALYTNTLGPILRMVTDRINAHVIPKVDGSNSNLYVEFNILEKLNGSFEEQATAFNGAAAGHPYMSINEIRSRLNLPRLEGFDDIITPTNNFGVPAVAGTSPVLAEIVDEAPQKAIGSLLRTKERAPETHEEKYRKVLASFFKRQRASVISKINSKDATAYWDEERWNRELAADLLKLSTETTVAVARQVAEKYDLDPEAYDVDLTLAWLTAVAESNAANINTATKERIEEAMESEDEEDTPEAVFDEATTSRTLEAAVSLVTLYSSFATVEAGKQLSNGKAMKTWIVTSIDPRNSHRKMNGETVGIDDKFSNGAKWPGDAVLGAEGVANCKCEVEMVFP
jgi:HK97 family phage portal protein